MFVVLSCPWRTLRLFIELGDMKLGCHVLILYLYLADELKKRVFPSFQSKVLVNGSLRE